jgi:DNA-binding NarL/FixJ family response regulator
MSTDTKITVGLVDDNRMFAGLMERELNRTTDLRCIGHARSEESSKRLVSKHKPTILLMDVFLPNRNGVALAAELVELHDVMRVIIFTNMPIEECEELQLMATSRRSADAWDFVSHIDDTAVLFESIRSVALGHRRLYLEEAVERSVAASSAAESAPPRPKVRRPSLSATESYVLKMLGKGLNTGEIRSTRRDWADKDHAVESHLRNLRNKFGVNNQVQLVLEAQRLGLLDVPNVEVAWQQSGTS